MFDHVGQKFFDKQVVCEVVDCKDSLSDVEWFLEDCAVGRDAGVVDENCWVAMCGANLSCSGGYGGGR